VLFAVDVAMAPSLKHVMTATKVAAVVLGVIGLAAAINVLHSVRRARRSPVLTA
jgi:hypothetical protein